MKINQPLTPEQQSMVEQNTALIHWTIQNTLMSTRPFADWGMKIYSRRELWRYAMLLPLTEPAEHNSRPMLLSSFGIICWTTVSVL